jgi:tetratricopeptide (TPR) repeat protein
MNQACFRLLILIPLFSLMLSPRAGAQAQENDFEFYKKNGHSSKAWDESVKKGFEAYDKQDCNATLTFLKEAIAAQAQDGLVFYKVAVCSEVTGTPYTALQYYQLAEEKLMKLPQIHRYQRDVFESYGRALFQAKRYDQAFPYLSRAVALGTPSFGLFYMVGYLHMMKGDTRAAIELFEKALAQDTAGVQPLMLANVYREVAKAYYANKDYQKAMQLVTQALNLNPQDQEAMKIKNELSNMAQQQSIVQMIEGMTSTTVPDPGAPKPQSAPPPPAAGQLPPLNPPPAQDPTPPLGTVVPPGTAAPPPAPPAAPPAAPPPAPPPAK